LGELTLGGELRPVSHFIPLVEALIRESQVEKILVPFANQIESTLFRSNKILHFRNLNEAIRFCFYDEPLVHLPETDNPKAEVHSSGFPNLDEVVGHGYAKRVLAIALAGFHPLLLEGPPGSGKTLLSHSAASLLPDLNDKELVEVSRVYSFLGEQREGNRIPPFRSPHHSISAAAFLGGGCSQVLPGELSLAHRGLLFLDELPEFRRDVIEGLREPLQNGEIHLHRISKSICLPARFSLIAAMNPCPCGYSNSHHERCSCSPEAIRNYRKKISGPILDRFPLYLWLETSWNQKSEGGNGSHATRLSIENARCRLKELNLTGTSLTRLKAHLDGSSSQLVSKWETTTRASFRRIENSLRVALTAALLDRREIICRNDLEEAWSLRSPENLV
jgi:magnesium chelatase family protein